MIDKVLVQNMRALQEETEEAQACREELRNNNQLDLSLFQSYLESVNKLETSLKLRKFLNQELSDIAENLTKEITFHKVK